jgi:hypothetical protein
MNTNIDMDMDKSELVFWNSNGILPIIVCHHEKQTSGTSKQMEVRRFQFLFAANKQKSPFSISSVFHVYIYMENRTM